MERLPINPGEAFHLGGAEPVCHTLYLPGLSKRHDYGIMGVGIRASDKEGFPWIIRGGARPCMELP
jgi:hypothetical protein